MDWNDSYELIMRGQGLEPYGCDAEDCGHVSRGSFGMVVHRLFGDHGARHPERATEGSSEADGTLDWREPRTAGPWREHFGLSCSDGNHLHQPHPDPWWSGDSVFALEGQRYRQPSGPFYHGVLIPEREERILEVGDYLLSPAERQTLVPRIEGRLESDGCISYLYYDVHAVYLTNSLALIQGMSYYEVEPEGPLWPDPERPIGNSWCCARARIIAVHRNDEAITERRTA